MSILKYLFDHFASKKRCFIKSIITSDQHTKNKANLLLKFDWIIGQILRTIKT